MGREDLLICAAKTKDRFALKILTPAHAVQLRRTACSRACVRYSGAQPVRCPIPLPRYARPKETWTRDRICDPGHSTLARGWGSQSFKAKTPILFVAVWLACGIFAAGDEFHQSFMPSRTVVSSDVLVDICGATIGLAICLMVSRKHRSSAAPINLS